MTDAAERQAQSSEPQVGLAPPQLVVPWSRVALLLAILSVGSLAALAIVAAVKNADVLSTIALALAVVAFSAQLVIGLAQTNAINQQTLLSERVNTETRALLADVRATSQSVLSTIGEQFDTVLRYALGQAIPEAVEAASAEEGLSDPQVEERLQHALEAALGRYLLGSSGASLAPRPRANIADLDAAQRLQTFPNEAEGHDLVKLLESLTPLAANQLRANAEREQHALRNGRSLHQPIVGSQLPLTEELLRRGLAQDASPPSGSESVGTRYTTLTPLGREVARLLLGKGDLPGWLRHELEEHDLAEGDQNARTRE
jgi:hypothetical protein